MRDFSPSQIENYIVKYCVSTGNGLGRVKNKKSTLKRLKEMLVEPMLDTSVTFAQYMALGQDDKLPKKAAPGYWLAAHFTDGRRKLECQLFRSMIVLDLDNIKVSQLEYVTMGQAEINRHYWIMHTTRAHCPEKPRVRVIIPANREMNATETFAISRLISLQLADDPEEAIEIPDMVSFRFNQAMFKPSISRGQEYWMDENESGLILDVDAFLAANPGWEDYTLLPYQEAEKQRGVVDPDRKMENPHEKPGPIGAWCRVYDVEEAIAEFLSDVYAPGTSDTETRYTYTPGSGSNGAVVYDDGLFLHSNHGTDPAEGLHNSFDLIRLHIYGHLDAKSPDSTAPGNLPSFKAMMEFARKDPDVMADLVAATVPSDEWDADEDEDEDEGSDDDGDDTPPPKPKDKKPTKDADADLSIEELLATGDADDAAPEDWASSFDADDDEEEDAEEETPKPKEVKWSSLLVLDNKNELEKSLHNCATIVRNHKRIAPNIALNDLDGGPYLRGIFKFPKSGISQAPVRNKSDGRRMTDNDTGALMCAMAAPQKLGGYNTQFTRQDVEMALLQAAEKNRYNPFLDKIERTVWDGVPRLATFFHDWFGAEDDAYHSELATVWFVAGVARQHEPGHRFDLVPIIGGKQGGGKTGAIEALGMGYGGTLSGDFSNTQKMTESTKGKTVIEVPELKGMSKSEIEDVKGYFTATKDTIRLAYRRNEEDFYRRCVYMGTTNQSHYLRDEENRRFCPVLTDTSRHKKIDFPNFLPLIPQFWAEAQHIYLAMRAEQPEGFLPLEFTSKKAKVEAERLQKESRETMPHEPVAEVVERWLNAPLSADQAHNCGADMWDDDEDGKGTVYGRNLVTVTMIREELAQNPIIRELRGSHAEKVVGQALKSMSEWEPLGYVHRLGRKARWYSRDGTNTKEEFVVMRQRDDSDVADLLG
ncbi:Virulence-associated protein E [Sulfitobacter brevis]|uniref:Virulence-associated protein E n=1 Tax=Sulfitobacter brevis TaxID=74348 RepID=A0A1I2BV34_9RHOB|nr:VapE domain-containing protein [Sulfitobacter brevis]SFE59243.1 Virulence-associated protein E [Sulfitobacter brevis]